MRTGWLAVACMLLMGAAPIMTRYATFEDSFAEFRHIYKVMQPIAHELYRTNPAPSDLQEGQIVISKTGTAASRLYWKVDNTTFSVAGSTSGG